MARMGATQAKLTPGNKNLGAAGFYSSTMYVSQSPALDMVSGSAFQVAKQKDTAKTIPAGG